MGSMCSDDSHAVSQSVVILLALRAKQVSNWEPLFRQVNALPPEPSMSLALTVDLQNCLQICPGNVS